jgi:hypothetical protein
LVSSRSSTARNVVSGHIAGQTDTMPLRVEKLFQEYNTPGSFADEPAAAEGSRRSEAWFHLGRVRRVLHPGEPRPPARPAGAQGREVPRITWRQFKKRAS